MCGAARPSERLIDGRRPVTNDGSTAAARDGARRGEESEGEGGGEK